MDRALVAKVAALERATLSGVFFRQVKVGRRDLKGSNAGGRWGPPGAFEVLYLGRPEHSIVIEAHRHLVEAVEGMRAELVGPRDLIAAQVDVTNIVDLRLFEAQQSLDLNHEILHSPARDLEAYAACRMIARAAHQLEVHGIVAQAGGGLGGETLALFPAHLPVTEQPVILEVRTWAKLPPDPRMLRMVEDTEIG